MNRDSEHVVREGGDQLSHRGKSSSSRLEVQWPGPRPSCRHLARPRHLPRPTRLVQDRIDGNRLSKGDSVLARPVSGAVKRASRNRPPQAVRRTKPGLVR